MGEAQALLQRARPRSPAGAHGGDLLGLRGAVHQARPAVLGAPGRAAGGRERSEHGLRRARRRQRHRRDGVRPEARRHGLQGPAGREGSQRRRADDPAQQGLPDARLRELHLDAQDGGHHPPPEHHRDDVQRGRRDPPRRRRPLPGDGAPEGALRRRGRRARAASSARRPARWPSPTSSTPTWSPAGPPTSPSPRRCPRRRSSTAQRQLAVHVRLPGRDPGPRLRVADPQRRVREGLPARARGDAARRHARARLLRAVRGRVHPRLARGDAPDPPAQALHLRPARRDGRRLGHRGGRRRTASASRSSAPAPPA